MREQNHSEQKKHKEIHNKKKNDTREISGGSNCPEDSKKPVVQPSKLNPLLKPAAMKGGKPAVCSLNCSTAAPTPAGCRSRRSPADGAGTACLHGDPDPWPSHSPGSEWDRGSLPLHWGSGKSCYSAPGKTWIRFRRKVAVWDFVPWLLTPQLKYTLYIF